MSIFSKIWGFLHHLATRPGLKQFLSKYEKLALEEVVKMAKVHSGEGMHAWRDEAWGALKVLTQSDRDNWVSLLLALVFETIKARE